jgi:hypothetical protein
MAGSTVQGTAAISWWSYRKRRRSGNYARPSARLIGYSIVAPRSKAPCELSIG